VAVSAFRTQRGQPARVPVAHPVIRALLGTDDIHIGIGTEA